MRSLTVWVVLAAVAGLVAAGCGPKKEEAPRWDPALATSEAAPAEPAPAITEISPPPPPAAHRHPVGSEATAAEENEAAPSSAHAAKTRHEKTPAGETSTPSAKTRGGKPPAAGRTYTVKAGDTLSGIAKHVYGDANQWKKIADANKDKIHNKNRIIVGMVLTIPPK
jgi:nucleoid-associated protein YgaU